MQILSVRGTLPEHTHTQDEITAAFADVIAQGRLDERVLRRFHRNAGVSQRHLALPLAAYGELSGFTEANDHFISEAVALGSRAVEEALKAADLTPSDVDLVVSATVTGLAIPSLDARIASATGMRPDVKRVPIVGLGCVAGAAGVARLHDYLVGHPGQVAVLVAVELCSLTVQRDDVSVPNLVASGLFGDGAAAVVARGEAGEPGAARVLDTRSRLYPDSERTMGFDVTSGGLRIVLDAAVPQIVRPLHPRRRRRLPGLPRPDPCRRRVVGLPPGRAQGDRGAAGGARARARGRAADLGVARPRSATCRRPRCCTCSRTPCATSRPGPAPTG